GVFWISVIARSVFSEITVSNLINEYCTFALVVCDVFLYPKSKSVIYDEKNIKCYIENYLNDFNNDSLSYNSLEKIMDEAEIQHCSESWPNTLKLESNTLSQDSSSRAFLSQEDMDELFGFNYYAD
ncbi:10393_t:CDS:2, partial [Racocetra persica]